MIHSDTLEFLNLLQEEPEKGEFISLKIENYDLYHVEPMIFPANFCETLEISDPAAQKESVLYFFGGEIRRKRLPKNE